MELGYALSFAGGILLVMTTCWIPKAKLIYYTRPEWVERNLQASLSKLLILWVELLGLGWFFIVVLDETFFDAVLVWVLGGALAGVVRHLKAAGIDPDNPAAPESSES